MTRSPLTRAALVAAFCLPSMFASADVVLLSQTVGNGSFEDPIYAVAATGTTQNLTQDDVIEVGGVDIAQNANAWQLGGDGGNRYGGTVSNNISPSSGEPDPLIIPGWYFNKDSIFGGLNHSNSSIPDHGLTLVQTNGRGDLRGVTDTFTFDPANGLDFRVGGAFAWQSSDAPGGDYSLLLRFDPGGPNELEVFIRDNVDYTAADELPSGFGAATDYPIQVDEVYSYAGSATTVRLEFLLDSRDVTSFNSMADDFHLTQLMGTTPVLLGDYNDDGVVNIADYTVWRDNLGADETSGVLNGNGNGGTVDTSDYTLWKSQFGEAAMGSFAAATATSVPEPATLLIALLAAGCLALRRRG